MLTFRQFVRAFTRQHHPSVMNTNYVPHPRYYGWAWRVYCKGGQTFIYSLDLLDELYQSTRIDPKDPNQ